MDFVNDTIIISDRNSIIPGMSRSNNLVKIPRF